MGRYLYQKYINAPDTVFEHVYKVAPGEIVTVTIEKQDDSEAQLTMNQRKYWDIASIYHKKKNTGPRQLEDATAQLKQILEKAVRQRMIADVPLGTFLSGGYDSTLVTGIAQSISQEPVKDILHWL